MKHYMQESEEINAETLQQLRQQLNYVQQNSVFYQKLLKKNSITPGAIGDYPSFRRIPLTSKEDLQNYNEDFLCVPREDIIDWVTTSGTLGRPVNFSLNEADLQRLAQNEQKSFEMVGITKKDVVQIITTLDRRFMAGMAYFLGLRQLGAGVVRTGSGLPGLQWDSIARFKPRVLVTVPSFLLKMIKFAKKAGIDYQNSSVEAAVCIGEPLRNTDFSLNALGKTITELWNIELFSTYASTEMSTAFTECGHHTGNHSLPELIFPEVLNEAGAPVKSGEAGELVVTPLQVKTMPLVRFATGDIVKLYSGSCSCGRNSKRISTPIGRKKQMLKFKGTSLYPQQIIETLNAYGKLALFIIEASKDELDNDRVVIRIPSEFPKSEIPTLKDVLQSGLKVSPEIEQIPTWELENMRFPKERRKPVIFNDLR